MALYQPDTMRRRGITPFVADDATLPGTPPKPKAAAGTVAGNTARAAGTVAGQLTRQGIRSGTNLAIRGTNAMMRAETAGVNALSYPYRAAGGFMRDFDNAVLGRPESPNAGEPVAALKAPSIPTIDWNKDPARAASGPATAAEPAAAAPAAPARTVLFVPNRESPAQMATQMRAAGAMPAAPVAPVEPAAASKAATPGVTLADGRKLGYGAMVNGVPTFSDGSAGMPRTMSDAQIQGLGQRLTIVPPAAFMQAAPAFNSDNTEENVQAILRSREGGKFGITPEMNANADLAAVANQDARTTLGRAALNASRGANAATTTLQRGAALGDLAALREGVVKNAGQAIADAGAQQRANTDAQATLQRQELANTGAIRQQALQNEGELARTGLAGKYSLAGALAAARSRGVLTEADLNSEAVKLLPQVLGLNPAGMVNDPGAPGGMRPPNMQEIEQAMLRSKQILSGQAGAGAGGAKPSLAQFIAAVRARGSKMNDAQLKQYYQQNYGG